MAATVRAVTPSRLVRSRKGRRKWRSAGENV
jgi:hypothetical protein